MNGMTSASKQKCNCASWNRKDASHCCGNSFVMLFDVEEEQRRPGCGSAECGSAVGYRTNLISVKVGVDY
jgi:hypothetical protein